MVAAVWWAFLMAWRALVRCDGCSSVVGVPDGMVGVPRCRGGCRSGVEPQRCQFFPVACRWYHRVAAGMAVVPDAVAAVGQAWSLNAASSSRWRVGGTIVLQLAWWWFLMAWRCWSVWRLSAYMVGVPRWRGGCWSGVEAVSSVVAVPRCRGGCRSGVEPQRCQFFPVVWRWSGVEPQRCQFFPVACRWYHRVTAGMVGVPRCRGGCWSGVMVAASWWAFLDAVAGVGQV